MGPDQPGQRVLAHEERQEQGEEAGQQAGTGRQPQHVAHRPGQARIRRATACERRQRLPVDGGAVDVELPGRRVDPGREPDGEHRRRDVDDEGQPQRPVRADLRRAPASPPPRPSRSRPAIVSREFAVTRLMPAGRRRGTAAARATAYDRLATRQPRAAGKSHALSSTTAGESTREEGTGREGGAERPAPAVAEAVEQGADERREEHERRHRQEEEERDPAARLVGRQREHGAGERDRERGVPGDVDGVQLGEPRQAGVRRTVGVGGPKRRAAAAAGRPHGARGATSADGAPGAGPRLPTPRPDPPGRPRLGPPRTGGLRVGAGRGVVVRRHDSPILPDVTDAAAARPERGRSVGIRNPGPGPWCCGPHDHPRDRHGRALRARPGAVRPR